jgi:hypothetical protein
MTEIKIAVKAGRRAIERSCKRGQKKTKGSLSANMLVAIAMFESEYPEIAD